MNKIIEWIINNKEWVFSGIGVSILSIIITLFKKKSFNQVSGIIQFKSIMLTVILQ